MLLQCNNKMAKCATNQVNSFYQQQSWFGECGALWMLCEILICKFTLTGCTRWTVFVFFSFGYPTQLYSNYSIINLKYASRFNKSPTFLSRLWFYVIGMLLLLLLPDFLSFFSFDYFGVCVCAHFLFDKWLIIIFSPFLQ